jgi:hypothetical protein
VVFYARLKEHSEDTVFRNVLPVVQEKNIIYSGGNKLPQLPGSKRRIKQIPSMKSTTATEQRITSERIVDW